jgi:thymidylate kinase
MYSRGLIIEGISNSGKTTIFNYLKQRISSEPSWERTCLFFSEQFSQILYKKNDQFCKLTKEEHISLLDERISCIESLDKWTGEFEPVKRSKRIFYIFERFHLNHRICFGNGNIEKIEERIEEINGKCLLLHVTEEELFHRYENRENKKGEIEKSKLIDLVKSGMAEQEKLIYEAKKSNILTKIVSSNIDKNELYNEIVKKN